MTDSNNTNEKINQLGDDIKKQFEQLGNDIKDQMLKDFNNILNNDVESLRSTLNKIVEANDRQLVRESQLNLQKTIAEQFGGNIFGSVIAEALPALFNNDGSGFRSNNFREAAGQSLLQIGSSIARAQARNG